MTMINAKLSDVEKYNRMDPKFHCAIRPLEDRIAVIRETVTVEEARRIVSVLSLEEQQQLMPLARYSRARITALDVVRITDEYPFISLAILEQFKSEFISSRKSEMLNLAFEVDVLSKMS